MGIELQLSRKHLPDGPIDQGRIGTGTPAATNILRGDATWGALPSAALPAHATTHQHGGADEVSTVTPGANAIPKAGAGGKLAAGWVQEVLALVDLSDVTAKTGAGTEVVMSDSPTITTPVIAQINDAVGAEMLKTVAIGGAVNELTIRNSNSGTPPRILATGDDANIDLRFDPKGSGSVLWGTATLERQTNKGVASGYCDLDAGVLVPVARLPAATTSASGVVTLSTDGEEAATEAVTGSDSRLVKLMDTSGRVARSTLPSPGTGFTLVSDTAYFVYLGRVTKTSTFAFTRFGVRSAGVGAQTAEVGFFSTPAAPLRANQTVTKLAATGTVDDLTTIGTKGNTGTLAQSVAAGTHLWAGIRTALAVTQPALYGLIADHGHGRVLSTAAAGALTGAGPWTGALITDAGATMGPDLEGALD